MRLPTYEALENTISEAAGQVPKLEKERDNICNAIEQLQYINFDLQEELCDKITDYYNGRIDSQREIAFDTEQRKYELYDRYALSDALGVAR